jgi:protein-tyrosine phosphatase
MTLHRESYYTLDNLLEDLDDYEYEQVASGLEELERPDYNKKLGYFRTQELWSEVLPNLYQGGTDDFDTMDYNRTNKPFITKENFDTVITLYAVARPVDWFVKEIRYGVWDGSMADFSGEDIFDLVKVAHEDWKSGKKVLIRCQAGWNRSGLIMALVLMREGYTAEETISLIREKRSPYALCNKHFERFLLSEDASKWQGSEYRKSEVAVAPKRKRAPKKAATKKVAASKKATATKKTTPKKTK